MVRGKDIVDLALKHLKEEYVLGVQVPKDDPDWRGPWDCAEFASWLYFQLSGNPYGWVDYSVPAALGDAHTGAWARDARTYGDVISIEEAAGVAGAFVLRSGGKGGHIAVSDGAGGTVEAMGRRAGVTRGRIGGRRWDMGVLPPGVEYRGGEVDVAPPGPVYRLTHPCMEGAAVKAVQRRLAEQNFRPGDLDGIFGPRTERAVRAFQEWRGVVVDGEVGPVTAALLPVIL